MCQVVEGEMGSGASRKEVERYERVRKKRERKEGIHVQKEKRTCGPLRER